jgi:hypothetical protein
MADSLTREELAEIHTLVELAHAFVVLRAPVLRAKIEAILRPEPPPEGGQ